MKLAGASTVRSRLHAAAARGLTRFVGRDGELDQLRHALERARSGHGQVVAIVGEPGVGKSRLCWEFTRSPRTEGWLIIESSPVSYGKATAFLPIIDLLRAYFQIEAERKGARDPREGHRQAVVARSGARAVAAGTALASRCARRRPSVATPRPSAAAPAGARGRQAAAAPGEPGAAAAGSVRGLALDRCRDPGAARQPGREPADGTAAPAGQLPARISACLERQDLLPAAPHRSAAPRERRGAAGGAARQRGRTSAPQANC